MSSSKHTIRPRTLEAIMEAAIATFTDNPAASMSEVAIRAGIGRATLHRHFPAREDLTTALGVYCIEETNRAVAAVVDPDQPSIERLEGALRAIIPLGDRYSFLQQSPTSDETLLEAYRVQLRWVKALIGDLKRDGHMDEDIPERWALALIDQLIWTAWSQVSRGHLGADEAPALAVRTLLSGIGNQQ